MLESLRHGQVPSEKVEVLGIEGNVPNSQRNNLSQFWSECKLIGEKWRKFTKDLLNYHTFTDKLAKMHCRMPTSGFSYF